MTISATADVMVSTADGAVRGRDRGGSTVFYGLPYARAPIGSLAFERPVRPERWDGVRDATIPGATAQCRGFEGGTIPEPSVAGDDILTVNVFTPDPSPHASLPVLVWIHGGAYIAGSPISPWYDGGSFNRRGVVVVTVGYRLGVTGFGFVEGAPANRAVHDWLRALEWVQENIAAFGGDPTRVTIAGQSAGGGAVLTLLGTEGIGRLVTQAITMSPVTGLSSPDDAGRLVVDVARRLNVDPTPAGLGTVSRAALADIPWTLPNVFGAAAGRAGAGTDPVVLLQEILSSLEWSPTLDGELVRLPLVETPRSAGGLRIPLLIGSVAQEFNTMVPVAATAGVSDQFALESLGVPGVDVAAYLSKRSGMRGSALFGQALTDLLIRSAVPRIAEGRERTWVYDFTWPGQGEIDPGHAFHCLDLPFVWGSTNTPEAYRAAGEVPAALAQDMHDAWASFVIDGSPGWEPYANDRAVRCFDVIATTSFDGYAAERMLSGTG